MLNGGQEPADLDASTRARIRLMQRFAVGAGWKIAAIVAIDFVLLRIWAPDLVNMHNDLALVASIACLIAAAVVTIWLGFSAVDRPEAVQPGQARSCAQPRL